MPFLVYRSQHERIKPFAIKLSTLASWNTIAAHFCLCCAQNGIISSSSYCRCQCLSCLTLLGKSLLVSASKQIHPRFIVYLRVCSFYNEIYISKSSLAQTNMLLKRSFQNFSEWGNYDSLQFMFSLITLEGKLSAI